MPSLESEAQHEAGEQELLLIQMTHCSIGHANDHKYLKAEDAIVKMATNCYRRDGAYLKAIISSQTTSNSHVLGHYSYPLCMNCQ